MWGNDMEKSDSMDIQDVISRRISVRAYQPEPASLDDLEAVRRAGERAEALTDADMQFHLRTDTQMGKEIKGIIGDYGKTIHAPHYIVLASREREGYLTDAGFRFEQMILDATARGTWYLLGRFDVQRGLATLHTRTRRLVADGRAFPDRPSPGKQPDKPHAADPGRLKRTQTDRSVVFLAAARRKAAGECNVGPAPHAGA